MRHDYYIPMNWGQLIPLVRFDYSYSIDFGYNQGIAYSDTPQIIYPLNIANVQKNLFSGAVGLRAQIHSCVTIDVEYGGYGTVSGIFYGQTARAGINILF